MTPEQQLAAIWRVLEDLRRPGNPDGIDLSCLAVFKLYVETADDSGETAISSRMLSDGTRLSDRTVVCCRRHLLRRGHLIDTGRENESRFPVLRVWVQESTPTNCKGEVSCTLVSSMKFPTPSFSEENRGNEPNQEGEVSCTLGSDALIDSFSKRKKEEDSVHNPSTESVLRVPKAHSTKKTTLQTAAPSLPGFLLPKPRKTTEPILTEAQAALFQELFSIYPKPGNDRLGAEKEYRKIVDSGVSADVLLYAGKAIAIVFDRILAADRKENGDHPAARNCLAKTMFSLANWLKKRTWQNQPYIDPGVLHKFRIGERIKSEQTERRRRVEERDANYSSSGGLY